MMFAEFEDLLKWRIGLDANSIGSSTIERAVQVRLEACELEDVRAYWHRVCESETEFQELIEAVIVPETWFFRDKEAFVALARIVCEKSVGAHPEGVLRLLSLPCSTGEEPYSMAMALLEAGVPASRFRVDAVDVSVRALARGRRALYGKNSFRGSDLGFCDRHFEATTGGYQLGPTVRRQVQFQQGNLFDEGLLPGADIYDVVFCRNVLIYFDGPTQDRVIKVLTRLLSSSGVLFVAPAETGLLLRHEFIPARIPFAFAFWKADSGATIGGTRAASHPPIVRLPAGFAPPLRRARRAPARVAGAPYLGSAAAPAVRAVPGLDEAARLADEGRLSEAAKACEADLEAHGPSARAFYLLALMRDAVGSQPEAAEFYRKTLYLDPEHHEALVHLSVLLEKQGDKVRARVLGDRARRLEGKQRASHAS
jgi:chemotaxis protein methyltransferase WspC